MNCGMECVKYLLFIFNFIFALGGLAILVCGVLIHVALGEVVKSNVDVHISLPASVLIAIGAIIFIIAFFGCCGAIRESHCMVVTFAVLLLTLLVIQLAVATFAFITLKGEDVESKINKGLQQSINEYFDEKEPAVRDGINAIQSLAGCCGYNNYRDYLTNPKNPNNTIPYSCCNNLQNKSCDIKQVQDVEGCGTKLYPLLKTYANALGGLAIGIAVVELIGIIFSFCLANSIRNVERRGYKV